SVVYQLNPVDNSHTHTHTAGRDDCASGGGAERHERRDLKETHIECRFWNSHEPAADSGSRSPQHPLCVSVRVHGGKRSPPFTRGIARAVFKRTRVLSIRPAKW
ncbi:hypothetical protein BaRGS_00018218, partial [Batillaria attramentaria]